MQNKCIPLPKAVQSSFNQREVKKKKGMFFFHNRFLEKAV